MKKLLLLTLLFVTACAPSPETIAQAVQETQAAFTLVPSQTPYPTYTAPPTVFVTKLVIVTATGTATPVFTPTITNTPAPTNTKSPTPDPLKRPKGDGFYLIGVDIAPGVWRSNGTQDDCYWAVTETDGDIIDNHFGNAGGTAYLPTNGFQVEFNDCGTWEYLSPP